MKSREKKDKMQKKEDIWGDKVSIFTLDWKMLKKIAKKKKKKRRRWKNKFPLDSKYLVIW